MPTRVLSYRRQEMTWECKTGQGCECYGLEEDDFEYEAKTWERELYHGLLERTSKGNSNKSSFSQQELLRWWCRGIQTVTTRSLTYDSDRLPAVSGIAQSVQAATGDIYLAGVWKSDLPNGIRWRVNPWRSEKKKAETSIPEAFRAPTWSWSSVTATIATPGERDNRTPRITVIDAYCTPASANNPFGWVWDGYVRLTGYVFTGVLMRHYHDVKASGQIVLSLSDLPPQLTDLEIDVSDFRPDTILVEAQVSSESGTSESTVTRLNISWYEEGPKIHCSVQCLLLNTADGDVWTDTSDFLVLGRSLRVSGAYERVGFLEARMKSPFKDTSTRVIDGLAPTAMTLV